MAFAGDWLALREAYDARARNSDVLAAFTAWAKRRNALSIVDLGCGTGATLRALSPKLSMRQAWRLVDNDLSLLARATENASTARMTVGTIPIDLAHDLEAALDGLVDVVTVSALLDLVSATWLDRFVTEIAARQVPIYAALSYDGRVVFTPSDPLDGDIVMAVNAHQRGDKGFGPALGPDAVHEAIRRFRAVGYEVVHGRADWLLTSQDREMQTELLNGYAGVARSDGNLSLADLAGWLTRRREALNAGEASLLVGHVDFFAWPTGSR